jgi:hypothetical protein
VFPGREPRRDFGAASDAVCDLCCAAQEKLTRVDIWATFLIIVGATLSTSFGDHREVGALVATRGRRSPPLTATRVQRTYDVPGLYVLFERPEFIIFQCITLVSVFVLWLFITRQLRIRKEAKATANIHVESILKTPAQRAVPFACGLLAGLTGSQQNVLTKCFSELFSLTLQGHNQFKYLLTYVLMASAIFFAIFQIGYVSKGLEHFDAVFYLPVYNAFLIVLGIVAGSVYFNEISSASAESVAFFCVGVTITLSGVLLLTQRKKPEEEDEDEDEDEGGATDEGDGSNSDPERLGGLRESSLLVFSLPCNRAPLHADTHARARRRSRRSRRSGVARQGGREGSAAGQRKGVDADFDESARRGADGGRGLWRRRRHGGRHAPGRGSRAAGLTG